MHKRTYIFALCITLLMLSVAWAREPISGVVMGKTPLSGVQVQVVESGESTMTDASGRFTITPSATGPVTLRFSLQGYKPLAQRIDPTTSDVIVSLKPGS